MDEVIKLKAEAFDLLMERQTTTERINHRLNEIQSRLLELENSINQHIQTVSKVPDK